MSRIAHSPFTAGIILEVGDQSAGPRLDLSAGPRTQCVPLAVGQTAWTCYLTPRQREIGDLFTDLEITIRLDAGDAGESTLRLEFELERWSPTGYLFMPAAVYAGNRFNRVTTGYPPVFEKPSNGGPDTPPVVAHTVVGFTAEAAPAPSRIEQLSRDLATPAVGAYLPEVGQAFLLLAEPTCGGADIGLVVEESDQRSRLKIQLLLPGRRPKGFYDEPWRRNHPSRAPWTDWTVGQSARIRLRFAQFASADLQGLFDRYFAERQSLNTRVAGRPELPFSAAFEIQQRKFLRDNWNKDHGYVAVDTDGRWQTGWCGGLISTHPLLCEGSLEARQRVVSTLNFFFDQMQSPEGLFYGAFRDGHPCEDQCVTSRSDRRHLMRKSADALYFLLKHLHLFREVRNEAIPEQWLEGTQRCAAAFVRIWRENGQFGHLYDHATGKLTIEGSTSASLAPAGLALAAGFFGRPDFLAVAKEAADGFYARFVRKGLTTGGPGDALTAPDSESAFGLLESFVVLHEVTGEKKWVGYAEDLAKQCSTWVTSYDYPFPPNSTFGKLNLQTTGAVWANVQNKHGAPGICTLSGVSLFKLFRATGDQRYLELIRDIAHALPQFLSRQDRPVGTLPEGWMCERVNLSDWMEPSGEIFHGSCWCEISLMLSYTELPGVYVNSDTGVVCALDHVEASLNSNPVESQTLILRNPTAFAANVKVWCENSNEQRLALGQNYLAGAQEVFVPAGGCVTIPVEAAGKTQTLVAR